MSLLRPVPRWLDEEEEDGRIERVLGPSEGKPWLATVTTGQNRHACPKVPIVVVLYGVNGQSDEISLGNNPEATLASAVTEDFEVIV